MCGEVSRGEKVSILCGNLSSVVVVQTGRARDPFLQACLRELVFLQATLGQGTQTPRQDAVQDPLKKLKPPPVVQGFDDNSSSSTESYSEED